MTLTEIILIVALVALTSVLTAVGIQLFMLLSELRQTVAKVNDIIDETETRIVGIVRPLQQIGAAMVSVKSSLRVFEAITGWLNNRGEDTSKG